MKPRHWADGIDRGVFPVRNAAEALHRQSAGFQRSVSPKQTLGNLPWRNRSFGSPIGNPCFIHFEHR